MRKAIAIDFDGCLCQDCYPAVGPPNWEVIRRAQAEQAAGAAVILWTCRVGAYLQEAVDACVSWGLSLDAVNANLPERIARYGNDCRKVSADEYWDDRAVRVPDGIRQGGERMCSGFPARLRTLREGRRMSRKALSECCGLSKNMIGRYERGEKEPSTKALVEIADFFEVSTDYLLGRKNFFDRAPPRGARPEKSMR